MSKPPPLPGRQLPATHATARLTLHLREIVAKRLTELVTRARQTHLLDKPQPGVLHERSLLAEMKLAAALALAFARLPESAGAFARLPTGRRRGALPRPRRDRLAALRQAIASADYPRYRSSIPSAGFNSPATARKSARGAPHGNLNRLTHGRHARWPRAERARLALVKAEIADLIADCNAAVALFREAALDFMARRKLAPKRPAVPGHSTSRRSGPRLRCNRLRRAILPRSPRARGDPTRHSLDRTHRPWRHSAGERSIP